MTATQHADALAERIFFSDDLNGYPAQVAIVANDLGHTAASVQRGLGEGLPTIVVDGAGVETLIARRSRGARLVDRLVGRARVHVAIRRDGDAAFTPRGRVAWDVLMRELEG